jgi:GntR family transcriptional regulator/MocR family aminotransferase
VDGFVLEDDYDSEFRYDRAPVSTLQGMDPSRVVLLGSLSKTLSPALGIGWALTPRRLAASLPLDAPIPGTIEQLAFASLVETGAYDRHLRATRRRYLSRHDALLTALRRELPGCAIGGAAAGLHLLLALPDGADADAVVASARAKGVATVSLGAYCAVPGDHAEALVLGYGNLADADLPRAVSVLAAAVRAAAA